MGVLAARGDVEEVVTWARQGRDQGLDSVWIHDSYFERDGVSFAELAEQSWRIPGEFVKLRYSKIVHGVGLGFEYPYIPYKEDWEAYGYDGIIREGMTLCVSIELFGARASSCTRPRLGVFGMAPALVGI